MVEFSEKLQAMLLKNDSENKNTDIEMQEKLAETNKFLEKEIVEAKSKGEAYVCYKTPNYERNIRTLALENIMNNLIKFGFHFCDFDRMLNKKNIALPSKSFVLYKTVLFGFGGDEDEQADVITDLSSATGIMIKF